MPDQIKPEVGMGATYCCGSDKYPCTIVRVSSSGKTFWMKEDSDRGTKLEKEMRVHFNPGRGWIYGDAKFGVIVGKREHYLDPNF